MVSENTGRKELIRRGRQNEKRRSPNTWPINGHEEENGQERRRMARKGDCEEAGRKLANTITIVKEFSRAHR